MLTLSPDKDKSVPGREGKPGGCHQMEKKMLKEASLGQKVHGALG